MNKNTYIRQILTEHLLTDTYRKLTPNEAKSRMETVRSTLQPRQTFQSRDNLLPTKSTTTA
jgi:hypothetical protein